MKRLHLTSYTYHDDLGDDDFRELLARFQELGTYAGVIGFYQRLDGRGGFLVHEAADDAEADFELTLRYIRWMNFETIPIAPIEEALPTIQRVFG